MSANPLRAVAADESEPLAFEDALPVFQSEFKAAREAYVILLSKLGGTWLQDLLLSKQRRFTSRTLTQLRVQANEVADQARVMCARLDAAAVAVERAEAERRPQ